MKGAVLYGPRDVRFEERRAPKLIERTDATDERADQVPDSDGH